MSRSVAEQLSSLPASSTPSSPVRFDLLPMEIITKIFVSACPGITLPGEREVISCNSYLDDPLILSMVCRRWRAITMSYHPLWATLTIYSTQSRGNAWDRWGYFKLRNYLKRSASYPLRIHINGEKFNETVILKILDLVIAHCKRWKTMTIDFPLEERLLRKLNSCEGQLPLLETVCLEFFATLATVRGGGKFLSSPSLKRIVFKPLGASKMIEHIDWTKISEVVLKYSSFRIKDKRELRHILECLLISTQVLTFWDVQVDIDSLSVQIPLAGQQTPIRMEKLHKLRLETFERLLDLFVCPYLEHLEITGDHYGGKEVEIVRFLENSLCPLTRIHLSLETIEADPANLKKCYTILQSSSLLKLKSLSLTGLEDWIVDLLTFDSYKLLPSLEVLRLDLVFQIKERGTKFLTSRIEELKKIVESRTQSPVPNENKSSRTTETIQSNFIQHATLLKHCFFTFTLHTDQRRSPNDGPLAKTTLETLRLFCISRKVKTQLDIIFREDDDDPREYDYFEPDREYGFFLAS